MFSLTLEIIYLIIIRSPRSQVGMTIEPTSVGLTVGLVRAVYLSSLR